jgi:sigma-E factor negative regulatory protein RseA
MKDQISALMDDEFDVEGSGHLLTAIKAGGELAESWSTYHLIGDAMRGEAFLQSDLKHRVMQRLESEPTALAPSRTSVKASPRLWSVAASVAAVMFVGWMVMQQQTQNANDVAPIEIAQSLPSEYLLAHQANSANSAAYYIQPAAYESKR